MEANPRTLGALIIEGVRPSSPREVKCFLVIGGQQRLTGEGLGRNSDAAEAQ